MDNEWIAKRLDEITNIDIGVGIRARLFVDEARAQRNEEGLNQRLSEFERAAGEAKTRRIETERQMAEEYRRVDQMQRKERARAYVRSHPLSPSEIVQRIKSQGFRVGCNECNEKDEIQVAPDIGLDLENEAYLIEYAESLAFYLKSRSRWRTVVTVSRE
jgi:hypothetical protein